MLVAQDWLAAIRQQEEVTMYHLYIAQWTDYVSASKRYHYAVHYSAVYMDTHMTTFLTRFPAERLLTHT